MALDPHWYDFIDAGEESSHESSQGDKQEEELFRTHRMNQGSRLQGPSATSAPTHSYSHVHGHRQTSTNDPSSQGAKSVHPPGLRKIEMTLKADWQGKVDFPREAAKALGTTGWKCVEVILDTRYWHHLRFRNHYANELVIMQDEYGSWKLLTPEPVQLMHQGSHVESGAKTSYDLKIGGPIVSLTMLDVCIGR